MATPLASDEKSRSELVEEARRMGVERPERMTRVELRDEIVRRSVPEDRQAEARGLFGVARTMLASVVESGLKFPDAAKVIRGESTFEVPVASQTPVATVTLAEIYTAQGHKARALRILEDVLREEPEHEEALRVRSELTGDPFPGAEASGTDPGREAVTAPAPSASEIPGETTEYVPGGFVETTGEEIETGQPPPVETRDPPPVESGETDGAEDDVTSDVASEPSDGAGTATASGPQLVLYQSSEGMVLYWELPRQTLHECSVDEDEGRGVVKIVGFSARGMSPEKQEQTVVLAETHPLDGPSGCPAGKLRLDRFAEPLAVRAALGWESPDGFLPFTVGRSLDGVRADRQLAELAARATRHLA